MIEVVSAMIHRRGRILLTQRRAGKDFAFRWESPGGKVETSRLACEHCGNEKLSPGCQGGPKCIRLDPEHPEKLAGCGTVRGKPIGGESHHDALRREVREEIGVELKGIAESTIWCGRFDVAGATPAATREVFVLLYPAALADGAEPKALEGQGIGWFTIPELTVLHAAGMLAPANHSALYETKIWAGWQLECAECGHAMGAHFPRPGGGFCFTGATGPRCACEKFVYPAPEAAA
jgi:8-oxo-dGTP pyrophosphatase MutT (NUDIX family)